MCSFLAVRSWLRWNQTKSHARRHTTINALVKHQLLIHKILQNHPIVFIFVIITLGMCKFSFNLCRTLKCPCGFSKVTANDLNRLQSCVITEHQQQR